MREIRILVSPLIHVSEEREDLYTRLKQAIKLAEAIANDPDSESAGTMLEALRAIAQLIAVGKGILKDAQLDEIERELEEARRQLDEYKAKTRGRAPPPGD